MSVLFGDRHFSGFFLLYYPIINHNVLRGHSAHVSTRELPCYSVNDFVTNEMLRHFAAL